MFHGKNTRIDGVLSDICSSFLGREEEYSYLSQGYLCVSESNKLHWNSNSALRVLIPNRYPLHHRDGNKVKCTKSKDEHC